MDILVAELHHRGSKRYITLPSRRSGKAFVKSFDILREPKANQQDKISFRVEDLRKFFPKSYTAARIQETILKLLSDYQKKRQRENAR